MRKRARLPAPGTPPASPAPRLRTSVSTAMASPLVRDTILALVADDVRRSCTRSCPRTVERCLSRAYLGHKKPAMAKTCGASGGQTVDDLARFGCHNQDCHDYGQRSADNLTVCRRMGNTSLCACCTAGPVKPGFRSGKELRCWARSWRRPRWSPCGTISPRAVASARRVV
jgi:hypothetical protein